MYANRISRYFDDQQQTASEPQRKKKKLKCEPPKEALAVCTVELLMVVNGEEQYVPCECLEVPDTEHCLCVCPFNKDAHWLLLHQRTGKGIVKFRTMEDALHAATTFWSLLSPGQRSAFHSSDHRWVEDMLQPPHSQEARKYIRSTPLVVWD